MSQQLMWSHFVEILPIQDELKRDFYVTMCMNENWSVRTLIALILCAEKSQETIELMELNNGNIHVGQYLTKMPPKELLEQKLSLAIANAREQLEQRNP